MAARRVTLVNVYRKSTDCIYKLILTLDAHDSEKGVSFTESYDYGPMADDPGREYGYTAYSPYSSIAKLTTYLEQRFEWVARGNEPEEQLVSCFVELVAKGELRDGRPLQFNYSQVLAWFEAAGVPAASSTWSWISSS